MIRGLLDRTRQSLRTVLAVLVLCLSSTTTGTARTDIVFEKTDITADHIQYNPSIDRLSAEGNVRVSNHDWKITGSSLFYEKGRLIINGPIYATHGENTVLLADQADIDPDAMANIMRGVQVLVNRQMQLASSTFVEDDEGNVIIRDAIVTGCRICKPGQAPLWHFRATAIIIPAGSPRAYLKNPALNIGSVELGGIPWLSIPARDGRYSGFLAPSVSYSGGDGAGLRVPYFLTLGDHAGLILAPGVSTRKKAGLNYEYQHRFAVGMLDLEGTVNRGERDESFIGEFIDFKSDWRFDDRLTATLSHSSDNDEEHEHFTGVYSGDQDLSVATLTHRSRQTLLFANLVHTNPVITRSRNRLTRHLELGFRHHTSTAGFDLAFRGWGRESRIEDPDLRAPAPGPEPGEGGMNNGDTGPVDPVPELVTQHYGLSGALSRRITLSSGLVARFSMLGTVDRLRWTEGRYRERGIPKRANLSDRVVAVDLSLPLVQTTNRQARTLEPFLQLVYARDRPVALPALPALPRAAVVLDQGNIRADDRFANDSLHERGLRANLGLKLGGYLDGKASYELAFGTVYRREYDRDAIANELTPPMNGMRSSGANDETDIVDYDPDFLGRMDYVASAAYRSGNGLSVSQTVHVGREKRVRSAQSLLDYMDRRHAASIMLAWLRPTIHHRGFWGYTASAERNLTDRIALGASHSVGSENESAVESGINLVYRHQCAEFRIDLERTAYRASARENDLEAALTFRLGGFSSMTANGQEICR